MAGSVNQRVRRQIHLHPQPKRTTTFLRYNITLPPRQPPYIPSWMEKVNKTRQDIINTLNGARLKQELYLNRRCDSRDSNSTLPSPRMLQFIQAAVIDGGTNEHEDLEKQYQELRGQMFPPKSREKTLETLPTQEGEKLKKKTKSKKTRFKLKIDGPDSSAASHKSRTREVSDTASSAASTTRSHVHHTHHVQVAELLESDALGSDHFLKHLNCVKQLARRYRRGHRRQRHIAQYLDVQDH